VPTASNRGTELYYETAGSGPTVAFVGDAGYGAWLWGWHTDAVAGPHETVVFDHRGTGRSDTPPSPYDVPTLAADLEAVLADHGVADAHLVGAGLGGMVALRYAHEYTRAATLTLYCTAASGAAVDSDALAALAVDREDSLAGAFSPGFREQASDAVARIESWRETEDATGEAFAAQAAAVESFEGPPLYEVTQPAAVYYGVDDPVVPASAAESLARDLPRGTATAVEGRHCCFVEHATALTDRLLAFLADNEDDD